MSITFDRPKRMNGMTHALKRDLVEVLAQAQMDDSIRVVLFEGQVHFSAGDDMSPPKPGKSSKSPTEMSLPRIHAGHDTPTGTYNGLRQLSQPVNTAIRQLDKLTIAAMEGYAIQTGFSLALSCDFRIASSTAKMGSATLRFGLLPDEGGQKLLVDLMGLAKAMDFLMRKRIVGAEEALEKGLVHEVVAPAELHAAAFALANELASGPQVAMRMLKRSLYTAAEVTWAQSLEDIASKTAVTDHHPDAAEGVLAFQEKREPHFNAWLEAGEKSRL
jgi:2-(1,2-epoxy-1,2-dihydrophenyl)acetyl-CoA isomerase